MMDLKDSSEIKQTLQDHFFLRTGKFGILIKELITLLPLCNTRHTETLFVLMGESSAKTNAAKGSQWWLGHALISHKSICAAGDVIGSLKAENL